MTLAFKVNAIEKHENMTFFQRFLRFMVPASKCKIIKGGSIN